MAGCLREGKVEWLPQMLYGGSFLRYILDDFNYALDEGMILVADDEAQSRKFLQEYCRKTQENGIEVSSWKKRKKFPDNFCCGIMRLKTSTKEEEVTDFLSEKKFLPVVISGGVLPDYLRCGRYIFRLGKEDIEAVSAKDFESQITDFRAYVLNNVSEILRTLRELDTSISFEVCDEMGELKNLYRYFVAVGVIWKKYWRKTYSEREAEDFFRAYLVETFERMEKIPDFASGEEISETIASCVWEFMSMNEGVVLADVEAVGGVEFEALKEKHAILFDAKFYYFPQELFLEMCKPVLETVSHPEFKEKLKELGIIHCSGADKTVKKTVTTVYGGTERIRFLWLHKEFLLSHDNLRLEDIYFEEKEEIV